MGMITTLKNWYADGIFQLEKSDWAKGLVMAVLVGFAVPVDAALHTPGFSLLTLTSGQISQILGLAANGAIIGFLTYLSKQLLTNKQGQFMGRIG